MITRFKKSVLAFALLAFVAGGTSGCTDPNGPFSKQNIGTVVGAAGGGVIGSRFGQGSGKTAAIIGGTLLGAFVGNEIGASLDRADMAYLGQTQQRALESAPDNTQSAWRNPNSQNAGTVTPVRTYETGNGQYCREFQQTITVGGKTQSAYGTACRQPDGQWQIVN